ncbi:hypothetical protein [Poritiphilus flavus]|uniref:Uncharacterized protein n=1 Tax=Poritiphilus flavus TaxID=2697053 RepID=A0A6L9ECM8_9FLAO|nr:hypothetical protein [Poritiphilus flavus]NAS12504.1 hypothetical protein [Poritiphilus flavus]
MTKTTTNLVGILITILAGTYFFATYCSECRVEKNDPTVMEVQIPSPDAPKASTTGPEVTLASNNVEKAKAENSTALTSDE